MDNNEILRSLDRIQATLTLAFAPQLEQAKETIRADAISAAILDSADDWCASKNLQEDVVAVTGKSARSVRDRLPQLVEQGVLEAQGTERNMEYRRTGLV